MNCKLSFLITVYHPRTQTLKQYALKVDRNYLEGDCALHPMERENRQQLRDILAVRCPDVGIVVKVEEITDVVVIEL